MDRTGPEQAVAEKPTLSMWMARPRRPKCRPCIAGPSHLTGIFRSAGDMTSDPSRTATGWRLAEGLAPYWFEVDAAAFIGEGGQVGARLEAEYECLRSAGCCHQS